MRDLYGHVTDFNGLWNYWSNFSIRQDRWKAAQQAIKDDPAVGDLSVQVLQVCKYDETEVGKEPNYLASRVDAAEEKVFGRTMTSGTKADRLLFWQMVELAENEICPSDLLEWVNVGEELKASMLASLEVDQLPEDPKDPNLHTRKRKAIRLGNLNAPRLSRQSATQKRQWAWFYLEAGNLRSALSRLEIIGSVGFLTKPIPHGSAQEGQDGYRTLQYWRRYGIESIHQLTKLRQPHRTPLVYGQEKLLTIKLAEPTGHRSDDRELLTMQAKQYVRRMARSKYPRMCLCAQRLSIAYQQHRPGRGSIAELEAYLNQQELELLGMQVTSGSYVVRSNFWDLVGRLEPVHQVMHTPSGKLLMQCAEEMIKEGADPTWHAAAPYDCGRGGLSDPISPVEYGFLEEETKKKYQTLVGWTSYRDYPRFDVGAVIDMIPM